MFASSLRCVFAAGLFATALPAQAVTVYWPSGAAPCNTTLQACIDATPNGNTVSIETDTPINESLNLYNRSLSLVAGDGRRPSLTSGNWITVSSAPILGDQAVTLRGLRLSNSYVRAVYLGTGTATFDFSGLVLEQTSSAPTYIRVEARAGNTVDVRLYDNRLTGSPAGADAGSIELVNAGGTLNARAYFNQVTGTALGAADGAGLRVDVSGGGDGSVKLHGNTVRGSYLRGGIYAIEGHLSATASNFDLRAYNNVVVCNAGGSGNGIGNVVNNGRIHALIYNNTLTRCYTGIFATQQAGGGSAAEIAGQAKNNLIVGERGLAFTAAITASFSNSHNLLNVAANPTAPGPNTVTLDAKLVNLDQPRLRPGSPAINAGDNASLALGLILNGLPTADADGLRRFKGDTPNDADIGAYEYGDRHALHLVSAANTVSGYITRIDDPVLNSLAEENPQSTPNWNGSGSGISNNNTYGIYYFGNRWLLFNQDRTTPMPQRAAYNLFVPAAGGGSFRHVSTAANSSGYITRMDASGVNNLPERIILVTQNWSAGASVYNAHPIGIRYVPTGASDGRWDIVNIDLASGGEMPLDAGFNVYAQEASPNAFRYRVSAAAAGIDHPLINNVPCAQLHVTRLYNGTAVPDNFDVYYGSSGRWYIYSYTTAPVGTQYNVVIDPAQVYECTDRIFASDFS